MERMLRRPEHLIAQARQCLAFQDWKGCLKACQMALFCEPAGDLFAAALYLKALSLSELGRIDEALRELRKVEDLGTLYPHFAAHAASLKNEILNNAAKTGTH